MTVLCMSYIYVIPSVHVLFTKLNEFQRACGEQWQSVNNYSVTKVVSTEVNILKMWTKWKKPNLMSWNIVTILLRSSYYHLSAVPVVLAVSGQIKAHLDWLGEKRVALDLPHGLYE